jgi:hypothetical protein
LLHHEGRARADVDALVGCVCVSGVGVVSVGVLEALGYINGEKVVQLKGRVACEVNTCDELLLTEIVFENVLEPLDPHEIAGLLSSLICQVRGLARACVRTYARA